MLKVQLSELYMELHIPMRTLEARLRRMRAPIDGQWAYLTRRQAVRLGLSSLHRIVQGDDSFSPPAVAGSGVGPGKVLRNPLAGAVGLFAFLILSLHLAIVALVTTAPAQGTMGGLLSLVGQVEYVISLSSVETQRA
jgi:hypothetical protein